MKKVAPQYRLDNRFEMKLSLIDLEMLNLATKTNPNVSIASIIRYSVRSQLSEFREEAEQIVMARLEDVPEQATT